MPQPSEARVGYLRRAASQSPMQQCRVTISDSMSQRRDREQQEIEQKLIEGLKSPAVPMGKNFWPNLRRTAHARAKAASRPAKRLVKG